MPLTQEQLQELARSVASTTEDPSDCEECFLAIAEYAEIMLNGGPIPDALKRIQAHVDDCHCCQDELQTLITALKGI